MSRTTEPGWYHAQGDPEGTVRHWNGSMWDSEPTTREDCSEPGDLFRRLGAVFVDGILWVGLTLFFYLIVSTMKDPSSSPAPGEEAGRALFRFTAYFGLLFLVFGLPIRQYGATYGKRLFDLEIRRRSSNSSPPGSGPTFLRIGLLFVSTVALGSNDPLLFSSIPPTILAVSVMGIIIHPQRLSLFDLVSGTRVVFRNPKKRVQPVIPMMEDT